MKMKRYSKIVALALAICCATPSITTYAQMKMYRESAVEPNKSYYSSLDYWKYTPQEIDVDDRDLSVAKAWGYKSIDEFTENEKVTLYSSEKTLVIPKFIKDLYLSLGWEETYITLYAPEGRTLDVGTSGKQTYLNLGWYEKPVITLYALDGRQENFFVSEADAQCEVGWYQEKPEILYTLDGRKQYFLPSEIDAQCAVGWYKKPPVTLYTLDGRSSIFPADKVQEQRTVGWYTASEIEHMNYLNTLSKKFYINQKVWKYQQNGYYTVGKITAINGGTISVRWDSFYDYDWLPISAQTDIRLAEIRSGVTLQNIYSYSADEIHAYK